MHLSDGASDGLQRARSLHGRTSGPTKRSTKGKWTAEEDEILRIAFQRFKGKNWKKIAECFKGRTDVQCLHRWRNVLTPDSVKGPWSKEEDEIIIEMVNRYGLKKWSTIAQRLPGRIGKQCRERWHYHLNPCINKEAWTHDEELTLARAHQIYGNKWAELTKFLPGRSDNSIKNCWNSSVMKKLDTYLASGLLSQSSEDDRCGTEILEASECSQGSTFQDVSFSKPEVRREIGDGFLGHEFCWDTLEGKDWPLNTNELPELFLPDLGKESCRLFVPSSTGMDNKEKILVSSTCLGLARARELEPSWFFSQQARARKNTQAWLVYIPSILGPRT